MFAMSLTGRPSSLKETMLLTYCPIGALSVIQSAITGQFCVKCMLWIGILFSQELSVTKWN